MSKVGRPKRDYEIRKIIIELPKFQCQTIEKKHRKIQSFIRDCVESEYLKISEKFNNENFKPVVKEVLVEIDSREYIKSQIEDLSYDYFINPMVGRISKILLSKPTTSEKATALARIVNFYGLHKIDDFKCVVIKTIKGGKYKVGHGFTFYKKLPVENEEIIFVQEEIIDSERKIEEFDYNFDELKGG